MTQKEYKQLQQSKGNGSLETVIYLDFKFDPEDVVKILYSDPKPPSHTGKEFGFHKQGNRNLANGRWFYENE